MGTRSLTRFIEVVENKKNPITCIYRQYDGYPSGHGKELAEFLMSGTMVNGYGSSEERQFNGIGCLAAQFIAEFKKGVGNIYIEKPNAKGCGEEFIYEIHYNPIAKELKLICIDVWDKKTLFEGNPKDFHTILQTA